MDIQSTSAVGSSIAFMQGNNSAPAAATGNQTSGVSATPPADTTQQNQNQDDLKKAVATLNQLVNITPPPKLSFEIDGSTHQPIVRVTDASTGELICQIPSAAALALSQSIGQIPSILAKQQA
jgi:flagellar protein FlaG